jgi:MFS family permease
MMQMAVTLFVPLYAQGVLGTSATLSGTIMLPLLAAMLVSNLAAGFWIAQLGRYKAFAVIGFGLATAGFAMLSFLDARSPAFALPVCLVVVGAGTGMIFPTLTLSYQSAVAFSQLGVATALNQFCRSMGATLGSALFGSLLIARFLPEVSNALPAELAGLLNGSSSLPLRDPQALLDPAAADALRALVPTGAGGELLLTAVRTGLAGALHWVFGAAALVAFVGFVSSLIWRDASIRGSESHWSPAAGGLRK